MARSVESRFIAIISGALLVVVAPLFTLFLILSSQQVAKGLQEHVSIVLAANSQALGKLLWDLDPDSVQQIAAVLVSDGAIAMVNVRDTSGQLDITQTASATVAATGLDSMTQRIKYRSLDGPRDVGAITVYFPRISVFSALGQMETAVISIFILAIFTVFIASILGNRWMVIQPLMQLTAAIEATRRLGSRHHVDWSSNDEIGRLAQSFNEMQIQLEQEEQELKRAHQRTTEIYNLTPAMLFSLDEADHITAVSDYWLLATGYWREEVLGRHFAELVIDSDRAAYGSRKEGRIGNGGAFEVTVRFLRSDGRPMDVLIVETEMTTEGTRRATSLSVMTDVTDLKQSEQLNRHQAITDHLTGLFNRQGFELVLDREILAADSHNTDLACLFIDLDRFKAINDHLGHAAGDDVLRQFVDRLKPLLRDTDLAARLGGDEFAILLTGQGVKQRASVLCERMIRSIFETPFKAAGTDARLSASIGVALYPDHAGSAAELLQKSDMAMYARKRDGKNGAQIFDPAMLDQTRIHAETEQHINAAISGDWFEAYFQPIVELGDGNVVGFEALMRMNHPEKGILSPAPIISVAEETGTIGKLGNIVLEKAIANLAAVSRLPGMQDSYVAVNFSPLQFEPGLPMRLAALLGRHNILPHRLTVEITEAVLMHDNPEIRTILDKIKQFGCRIALDDFGTGFSSLSYLNRFPVDIIKIDQSFTRAISDPDADISRKSRMLVEGITAISHKMACTVIAEGVETPAQWSQLKQIGVDCGQGYLFARPQRIEQLMAAMPTGNAGLERAAL
jgi:diguanylate cyclase (GGDEF)-like protein/PAS domain S-box-containing protein